MWSPRVGHVRDGVVARPTRLAGGLPDDEVFTSSTGALWCGGWATWGNEILTARVGQRRGGWGGFGGGGPVTGSSSGGNDGGGDVLEHREANWG
jgi:hypothetical protein